MLTTLSFPLSPLVRAAEDAVRGAGASLPVPHQAALLQHRGLAGEAAVRDDKGHLLECLETALLQGQGRLPILLPGGYADGQSFDGNRLSGTNNIPVAVLSTILLITCYGRAMVSFQL